MSVFGVCRKVASERRYTVSAWSHLSIFQCITTLFFLLYPPFSLLALCLPVSFLRPLRIRCVFQVPTGEKCSRSEFVPRCCDRTGIVYVCFSSIHFYVALPLPAIYVLLVDHYRCIQLEVQVVPPDPK